MGIFVLDVVAFSQARANLSELAERERIHLLLIDEAGKGLDDVAAGRVKDARQTIGQLKRRRVV